MLFPGSIGELSRVEAGLALSDAKRWLRGKIFDWVSGPSVVDSEVSIAARFEFVIAIQTNIGVHDNGKLSRAS